MSITSESDWIFIRNQFMFEENICRYIVNSESYSNTIGKKEIDSMFMRNIR
jgi:hypothetical protein